MDSLLQSRPSRTRIGGSRDIVLLHQPRSSRTAANHLQPSVAPVNRNKSVDKPSPSTSNVAVAAAVSPIGSSHTTTTTRTRTTTTSTSVTSARRRRKSHPTLLWPAHCCMKSRPPSRSPPPVNVVTKTNQRIRSRSTSNESRDYYRLDPPHFTTATMESKKLQQLQQANSHLAPQPMPSHQHNKLQSQFHHYPSNANDFRTTQSPVFQSSATTPQQGHQYQGLATHFGQLNVGGTSGPTQRHLQASSTQQQPHLHVKPTHMNHGVPGRYNLQTTPQQPTQSTHLFYASEQLYQNNRERLYQQAAGSATPGSGAPMARSSVPAQSMLQQQQPATTPYTHNHPINALQQQYQQLQQAKIQQQMQTQNEAVIQSQRTFALRQQLNPPVAQSHFHLGHGQSQMSVMQSQQQINNMTAQSQPHHQQQPNHPIPALRNIPPSTLNLTNQFQPATGPMKLNPATDPQNIYGVTKPPTNTVYHHQQQQPPITHNQHDEKLLLKSPSEQTPIIQQNHPGLVVNQACQTQLSGNKNAKSPDDSSSPSHTSSDRRKSTGTIHSIKSPVTKRPAAATVTLSGWLYKQGSDGLKVWRKRWFVLAEYCLFYYKGPEEEKVLGSVLLPSYIVSACAVDDKIYRKFAFKCEHQNMRTYWLAAETAESMGQWVRALTAATMAQGSAPSSDQTSQPSVSSLNPSGENSDSGIHTYQSHSKAIGGLNVGNTIVPGPVTPASDTGGGPQPLYANAPPKPRRANDGGYSSPSPENSIERYDQSFDQRYQAAAIHHPIAGRRSDMKSPVQFQPQPVEQIYDNRNLRQQAKTPDPNRMRYETNELSRLQAKSPFPGTEPNTHDLQQLQNIYATEITHPQPAAEATIRAPQRFDDHKLYGTDPAQSDEIYMQHGANKYAHQQLSQQQQLYLQQHQQQLQQLQQNLRSTTTANNYGSAERRTPDTYGRSKQDAMDHRFFSTDYEDIYNVGGGGVQQKHLQEAYRRPLSPPMPGNSKYGPSVHEMEMAGHHPSPHSVNMRPKSVQPPVPRPHSADFLEYEARHMDTSRLFAEPVRAPRPKSSLDINRTPDHMYYSEASYAEKMRQSAVYLQKPTASSSTASPMADKSFEMHQLQLQQQQQPFMNPTDTTYSPGAISNTVPRMHESDFDRANRMELEQIHQNAMSASASVPRTHRSHSRNANLTAYQQQQQLQQEQFLRSASARLPRKNNDEDPVSASGFRDGERKREESMKRLLEWKQRMLQSPLTRKGIQTMDANKSPSASMLQQHQQQIMAAGVQRSRSETHANAGGVGTGYNSYSSDDEASISVRNVHNLHKLKVKGVGGANGSSSTDINRNASNSNLNYYTHPGHEDVLAESYLKSDYYGNQQSEDVYGVHRQQQPKHRSLRQTQSRSGSRSNLNQIEQHEAAIRTLDVTAGDLLSRTHEELVLLLIQLRRQNSITARAIEQCCTDMHEIQNRIRTCDGNTRTENLTRLDQLKQQLIDLEKQYEKSKPLVNLVDNMVKLGSLYRNGAAQSPSSQSLHHRSQGPAESIALDRMEFNQRMQERRLLQDERKQWDQISPNQSEMQSKVQQLYQLDQLMHEESGTLQSLQRDKEDLERALGGLRKRIQEGQGPPQIIEAARKQQHTLERELSRVHQMLAENSKKLEQTVAGNARLEQELLILRQKLQASRGSRGSHSGLGSQNGGDPDSLSYTAGTTAVLESELRRVQNMVGDMQRQRQELSQAVRQLTENSQTLYQQIKPPADPINGSHTSLAASGSASVSTSHIKKNRSNSTSWAETDLDSMYSIDHGTLASSMDNLSMSRSDLGNSTTPLYIDTGSVNTSGMSILNCSCSSKLPTARSQIHGDLDQIESSGLDSDDLLENSAFSNLTGQEKPEPKTVRIVKRESERRHRDRERGQVANSSQHLDHVLEEEAQFIEDFNRSKSLPRSYLDTQELYTQPESKADRMHQQQPSASSMYASSPAIPIKYTDYYSMGGNQPHYPVSMSNVDSYMQRHAAPPNSYLGQSAPEPVINPKNPFHMYMATNNEAAQQPAVHTAGLRNKTESIQSLTKAMGSLSPIFQSEAARQIITEMAGNTSEENNEKIPLAAAQKKKRAASRDSRRYMTAPSNTINAKSMQNIQSENDMNKNNTSWRARDDLDMEVALRPRINAPDVVRSALGQREKISENSIDRLFAAPNKIVIPERYIPEQAPEMSPEEKKRRQEKVEVIKKMLSEAPINQSNDAASLPPSQISAEKKQREHLLQLNQILAQQVMQMSKIVAERAMADQEEKAANGNDDSDRDQSPVSPLPIYQQRDNFFS